jgi:ubiquitin-protein ligase
MNQYKNIWICLYYTRDNFIFMSKQVTIKKETVKRLITDVKNIMKSPLTSNGIYYKHDDEDMLKGYALIMGPSETPYAYGNYLFELEYPDDYPHTPPLVKYCTNGDGIRFNPNLYSSGKVCISLLNTWAGEQWTSCQTISTVLLTLCSLLNDTPLLNEPGVKQTHHDYHNYNRIIEYKNIDIAIIKMISKKEGIYDPIFDCFYSIMLENVTKNYFNILDYLDGKIQQNNRVIPVSTSLYHMNVMINYKELHTNFIHFGNTLGICKHMKSEKSEKAEKIK